MRRTAASMILYLVASLAVAAYVLMRSQDWAYSQRFVPMLLGGLLIFGPPSVFVFACPKYILEKLSGRARRVSLFVNIGAAVIFAILFTRMAKPYPDNFGQRLSFNGWQEIVLDVILLSVWVIFLIAGLAVLVRGTSSLIGAGAVVIWPCVLLVALASSGRSIGYEDALPKGYFFCCVLSAFLLAFAAGTTRFNSRLAGCVAVVAGLLACPWIYRNEFSIPQMLNAWIILNIPEHEAASGAAFGVVIIVTVELVLAVTGLGILRTLPGRWMLRRLPVRDRTWPAPAISVGLLSIWFACSVTPYRIPGAVDAIHPVLNILHIEKHGLQFRETRVAVWRDSRFMTFRDDRRWLEYQFRIRRGFGVLPGDVRERTLALARSEAFNKAVAVRPKPLRAWAAEGWYFYTEQSGILAYGTEYGTQPPPEIVKAFTELEGLPISSQTTWDARDVCLGFCYDPVAALGIVYVNQRCSTDLSGTRCS